MVFRTAFKVLRIACSLDPSVYEKWLQSIALDITISKEEAESFYILCKDIFSRFGVGDSKAQYDIDGTKVQKKQSLDHSKMIVAGLKASNFTSLPTFLQPIKAYTK